MKKGFISKMVAELVSPVQYSFILSEQQTPINQYIGHNLKLEFTGHIACVACGRSIKKTYQQGYCFPCTQKLAQCDLCILKPEQCHYHQGTCREPQWGDTHCMIPHYVYLSNTSALKVGITKKSQVPTRWIDQGAIQAIPVFEVKTRRVSGLVEVQIAKQMSDKTNWRAMLKGEVENIDLKLKQEEIISGYKKKFTSIIEEFGNDSITPLESAPVTSIVYPVLEYPKKISSFSFDKMPIVEGKLIGIKGQYLIFEKGVINIRKFGGYEIILN